MKLHKLLRAMKPGECIGIVKESGRDLALSYGHIGGSVNVKPTVIRVTGEINDKMGDSTTVMLALLGQKHRGAMQDAADNKPADVVVLP